MGDERLSDWIHIGAASRISGVPVVTLKRAAKRMERRLGRPVLRRWEGGHWHLSVTALRSYLRGDTTEDLRDEVEEIRESLSECLSRMTALRKFQGIHERRICRLEGRKPIKPIT